MNEYSYYNRPFIKFLKEYFKDKPITGIEIGVDQGVNSIQMMKNLNIKKLYCIDPYLLKPDIYPRSRIDNENTINSFNICKKDLYDKYNNIVFIKLISSRAIRFIKEDVDFLYIDGDHSYNIVKSDISLYIDRVKKGGIIAGDDYIKTDVKRAVDEIFINKTLNTANYDVIRRGNPDINTEWWLIKQ